MVLIKKKKKYHLFRALTAKVTHECHLIIPQPLMWDLLTWLVDEESESQWPSYPATQKVLKCNTNSGIPLSLSTLVSAGCLLPWSCRGWPAVSCRSWLCDKVNLFPWNCRVTGVSGWATRLCGPAMDASWAIFTTSPPVKTQKKS